MPRIALLNMPFAGLHMPSLALTQLKAVLGRDFPDEVEVDVFYLNHDFTEVIDIGLYGVLSDDGITTVTGLTDWLFREVAFPELADNVDTYGRRYKHALGIAGLSIEDLQELRHHLAEFIDTLIERYSLDQYSLVAFTAMFDQIAASIAMARQLKARSPRIVTVIGGTSCELAAGEVLARNVPAFDFVFSGPALTSFSQFVGHQLRGETESCHAIRGVYSSRNLEHVGGTIGVEDSIDSWLPLDYDGFLSSLRAKCPGVTPELFFETSRGCWWGEKSHCTFCGLNGTTMNFRSMAPEKALEQFDYLFSRYPDVSRFFAVDNILDAKYYASVLPHMNPPDGVSIFYEMKVASSEDRLKALKKAGITRVQPGIESLSTSVLTLMGKGTTAFKNIDFLKKARDVGLDVDWNLLLGFPNEDPAVYEKYLHDIPLLAHLPAPGAAFPVRFDRYSPYHQHPERFGLDLHPADFYELVFPFSEGERTEFAYFFSDRNFQNGYLLNLARWRRRVEKAVEQWIARWTQSDGGLQPRLQIAAGGGHVEDSRSGELVRHDVSPLAIALLELLERPLGMERISQQVGRSDDVVEREVEQLAQQGLLFEEGDRLMSLVGLDTLSRAEATRAANRGHDEGSWRAITEGDGACTCGQPNDGGTLVSLRPRP